MSKVSWPLRSVSHLVLALMLVGVTERHAAAQPPPMVGSGVVEGRVVDAATGEPLPGAPVLVSGSAAETSTDRDGRFRQFDVSATQKVSRNLRIYADLLNLNDSLLRYSRACPSACSRKSTTTGR
jgi:CarboxypepD_reg-like domain